MNTNRFKSAQTPVVRAAMLLAASMLAMPLPALALKVVSEKTVQGFKFPESCAYDPTANVLYVGSFGGDELKPGEKDNNGYISKVSLDGKILEEHFLPIAGVTMNKPKGIWVAHSRLWVTDIDSVWVFHTKTKTGKKLTIPGAQFANDVTIVGDTLYISDNRGDAIYTVTPADILTLNDKDAKITTTSSHKGVNPNGIYPARDGSLLMVGMSDKDKRGIWSMKPGQQPVAISKEIGRLDGLYQMNDGTLLVTDWETGSVLAWSEKAGISTIASGFKGPADLCAYPHAGGTMVVVPDLVKSELRMIQLGS